MKLVMVLVAVAVVNCKPLADVDASSSSSKNKNAELNLEVKDILIHKKEFHLNRAASANQAEDDGSPSIQANVNMEPLGSSSSNKNAEGQVNLETKEVRINTKSFHLDRSKSAHQEHNDDNGNVEDGGDKDGLIIPYAESNVAVEDNADAEAQAKEYEELQQKLEEMQKEMETINKIV